MSPDDWLRPDNGIVRQTDNKWRDRPTALNGRATLVEALGHCAAPRRADVQTITIHVPSRSRRS